MMKHFQKTLSVITAVSLLMTSQVSFAYDKLYHTYSQTLTLSPGVTHTSEQRMTDAGWFNVNMIRVDLSNPSAKSTVLLPEYISQKSTLLNLANQEKDIVAAINGDFFDTQGKSTLGMVVKDGEYITSSIHDDRFYTYLQMKDGNAYIAKVLGESTKLSKPGYNLDITYKNKPYLQYDRAILFDRNWGNASMGNTNSEPVIELVVVNNTIVSVALDPPPQKIPENGYIISAVGSLIPEIHANFKPGDQVELSDGGFLSHIDQAIGGGAKILSEGIPETDFSLNISGRHPRSALGFSEDNQTLFLVTVDGRNGNFSGMTQTELAYLMAEAGAYSAINLDGGGSSELVAKPTGSEALEIINYPSDGAERRIHNGIGIVNSGEKGPLDQLLLSLEQERYFVGSSILVDVKGIDANYHAQQVDNNEVSYTVEGVKYEQDGDKIIPLEEGLMTITGHIGSATGSISTTIIGQATRLSVSPQTARVMPGESLNIKLTGYDVNGYSAPLKLTDVSILQSGIKGALVDSKYTVTEPGSGYVRFSLGSADAFMSIGSGETSQLLHDFESQAGGFVSYPEAVKGSYALTNFAHSGNKGGTLHYDFKNDAATRAAYVKFGEDGLTLPENTNKIRLWVFGKYANNHWLRGKITDSLGDTYTIDFTKSVTWDDWQQVEASLPVGISPNSLDRLYLVETDPSIRDAGVVVFDDIEVVVTAAPPSDLDAMSASAYSFTTLDEDASDMTLTVSMDSSQSLDAPTIDSNEPLPVSLVVASLFDNIGLTVNTDKVQWLKLDNSSRTLSRSNNDGGWSQLLNFVPSKEIENTVIFLKNTYGFKNSLDNDLFYDRLNTLRLDHSQLVTLVYPGSEDSIDLIDGIWFIEYNESESAELNFDFDTGIPSVSKSLILNLDVE